MDPWHVLSVAITVVALGFSAWAFVVVWDLRAVVDADKRAAHNAAFTANASIDGLRGQMRADREILERVGLRVGALVERANAAASDIGILQRQFKELPLAELRELARGALARTAQSAPAGTEPPSSSAAPARSQGSPPVPAPSSGPVRPPILGPAVTVSMGPPPPPASPIRSEVAMPTPVVRAAYAEPRQPHPSAKSARAPLVPPPSPPSAPPGVRAAQPATTALPPELAEPAPGAPPEGPVDDKATLLMCRADLPRAPLPTLMSNAAAAGEGTLAGVGPEAEKIEKELGALRQKWAKAESQETR